MKLNSFLNNRAFENDLADLLTGKRQGHMGHWEYEAPNADILWENFLKTNKEYYIPNHEMNVIKDVSLNIPAPVTLICYGAGSNFYCKEALVAKNFKLLKSIVHIDRSPKQLSLSLEQGRRLFPHANNIPVLADFFEDFEYKVEGFEVSTLFGLTLFNVEGNPEDRAPTDRIISNLKKLRNRMSANALFITTNDKNTNKKSIEAAYAGQSVFAKNMLLLGDYDSSDIKFEVEYHSKSYSLAHYLKFSKRLCFNNSYKVPERIFLDCVFKSGFDCVSSLSHPNNHIALHILKAV